MNAIKSILFPTDFSEHANKALAYAADITRRSGGVLYLQHVYEIPLMDSTNLFTNQEETIYTMGTEVRSNARLSLEKLVEEYKIGDLPCVYLLSEGEAQDSIIQTIEDIQADLVVIGIRGGSAEEGIAPGSVTKSIIQLSSAPILAIPETKVFRPISSIVYATDLQYEEHNLLQYVAEVAGLYRAAITALHISLNASTQETEAEVLKRMVQKSGYPNIHFKQFKREEVMKRFNQYLSEEEVDILAMTIHTTSAINELLHKSLTKQLLLPGQIPLLAFVRKEYNSIFLG